MTIARTIGMAAVVAALSLGIASLGSELFYMHWLRSIVAHGGRQHLETTAEGLDRDIRTSLPAGSSRIMVEAALRERRMDYHFAAAHEIDASAPDLKGSNPMVQTTLSLAFHFDGQDSLTRIDSHAGASP